MYAIVEIGGMQFPVREGETLKVPRLGKKVSEAVIFEKILLVASDQSAQIGKPYVAGASVTGEVIAEKRDDRITVFKFKRRTKYRRKRGHRQWFTEVKINKIEAPALS